MDRIRKIVKLTTDLNRALYYNFLCKTLVLLFSKRKKVQKKYQVSLCLIFKDEAPFLKEWLDYHLIIGVDHFYLYNNNSTDNFEEVIKPYIERDEVTLIDWPYQQAQLKAYKHCYEMYRHDSNWISFLDADEFICLKYKDNIADWLTDYERFPSISVSWLVFGTGGRVQHNSNKLLIEQYIVSWDRFYKYGKCFINTYYDIANFESSHLHHLTYTYLKIGMLRIKLPPINQFYKFYWIENLENSSAQQLNNSTIQINHYFTKAWDVYSAKRKKTDVFYTKNPKENLSLFEKFEMNCITSNFQIFRFIIKLKIFTKEIS